MFSHLFRTIRESKTVSGVECVISDDGSMLYRFVILQKARSKVRIIEQSTATLTFDELKEKLAKEHPIVLFLSGRGILLKEVASPVSTEDVIAKVLPGSDSKELSATFFSSTNQSWVSVAKRTIMDDVASKFSSAGFRIIVITPGIAGLVEVAQSIFTGRKNLIAGNHELEIRANSVTISKADRDEQHSIEGQEVSSQLLPSFLAAIGRWLKPPNVTWLPQTVLTNSVEEAHRNQFKWVLLRLPFVFLAILTINFFVWSSLSKKESALSAQASVYSRDIDNAKNLQEQVDKRSSLVKALGINRNNFLSSMADRIGQTMPHEITLTQIFFNPVNKKVKEKEPVPFADGVVTISGETNKGSMVNSWLETLSNETWAKEVELMLYETDQGIGKFEIAVQI